MNFNYKGITINVDKEINVLTDDKKFIKKLTENNISVDQVYSLEKFINSKEKELGFYTKKELTKMKDWIIILKMDSKSDKKTKMGYQYSGRMEDKRMSFDFKTHMELEMGEEYIITGKLQEDTWYNDKARSTLEKRIHFKKMMILPNSINKLQFTKEKKTYTKPRYELHCHTVHSKRDAYITHESIKEAFEDGKLGTLAITNHGIPNCFVDSISKFGKSEHDVICGTELYVVDDEELEIAIDNFENENYELTEKKETKEGEIELYEKMINNQKTKIEQGTISSASLTKDIEILMSQIKETKDKEEKLNLREKLKKLKEKKKLIREGITSYKKVVRENTALIRETKKDLKEIDTELKEVLKLKPNLGDAERRHVVCLIKNGFETTMKYKGKEVPYNKAIYEFNKMISRASIENFAVPVKKKWMGKRPVVLLSELKALKEYFILGSACSLGFIVEPLINKDEKKAERYIDLFDYVEIQPLSNNYYLLEPDQSLLYKEKQDLKDLNRRVYDFAKKHNKPVVFTSDAHVIDKNDRYKRAIFKKSYFSMMESKNAEPDYKKVLRGSREETQPFLHSYDEMVEELLKQGFNIDEIAEIYNNEIEIAGKTAKFNNTTVIPKQLFIPEFPGVDVKTEVPKLAFKKMYEMYGDNPEPEIKERLEFELDKIKMREFEFIYYISMRIVQASEEIGYPVGSRGSIGSSLLAMFLGITDNNPLRPHQHCPKCHHHVWLENIKHGFDIQREACPECGELMSSDGFDGKFTSFLGFSFNKMPDVDLNIFGEVQTEVQKKVIEWMSEKAYKSATLRFAKKDYIKQNVLSKFPDIEERIKNEIDDEGNPFDFDFLAQGISGVLDGLGSHAGE